MSSVELERWTEALATLPPPQDIDPIPIFFFRGYRLHHYGAILSLPHLGGSALK
jgi:hypothetical protein